ncbi:MAG: hypothetical protein ACLFR8_02975 [Alkalispirochaeta sp.]
MADRIDRGEPSVPEYPFHDIAALFAALRSDPPGDEGVLERIYRRGMGMFHPDRVGDDGSLCIRFQEDFAAYRLSWEEQRTAARLGASVDPYALLRDLGLSASLSPRSALFATLYRFRTLGLDRWRVRTRTGTLRRNAEVIRTLLYWAHAYDPGTARTLADFLLQPASFGMGESTGQLYFMIRRMLFRGLDLLIRYQDLQRPATRDIAADTVRYALRIFPRGDAAESRPYRFARRTAEWILAELAAPPEPIGLDV